MGPVSTYWKPTLYQRMRSEEDRHGPYPWHIYRTCMTSREIPQTSENRKGTEDSVWQGKPQASFCYTKIQDVKTAGSRT